MKNKKKIDLPYEIWKKGFSKKFKIVKSKKLFEISRNNHNIARGYDIKFRFNKSKIIERYIIIQGLSVQILPIIYCTTNKKYYTILVKQLRIGAQKSICEFPSGSLSYKDKNFKHAAIREIKEELNLQIKPQKLLKLSEKPIIMQPVNSYLKCQFFYFKLKMTLKNLKKLDNIKTGVANQNEFCISKVIKLKKIDKIMNDSSLIAMRLLEKKLRINKKFL
tara:strand:- start:2017 stop:2676 length:660 start_codon:yes stop_codon:yes gene_type:complete